MLRVSEKRILVKGRRVSLQVRESSRGLLFPEDHSDKAEAIRAKVKVGAIRAKAKVGALARQCKCCFFCQKPEHMRRDCP